MDLLALFRRLRRAVPERDLQTRIPVRREPDSTVAPARYLSLVGVVRNEARYLPEWIEFHRGVGFEHVYLYDHASEDEPHRVLAPFVAEGFVTLIPWNFPWLLCGSNAQILAFAHALGCFGSGWRWMAFLDADEFLYPTGEESLPHLLRDYERFPALLAFWTMFGFSGHETPPPGFVIDNYVMRAPFGFHAKPKSIVNPREVVAVSNPHLFDLTAGPRQGFTETGQLFQKIESGLGKNNVGTPVSVRLRLNHYYTRSRQEFEEKLGKRRLSGRAADCKKLERIAKGIEDTAFRDEGIHGYIPELRDRLRARSGGV
ncbi:MAG: glycosyltransferase family 92 protein [Gemmatimonadales bacterium]|nr:glycosyltransferase family 92 protein [Gemmatimonadales bacterium]